MEELLARIAANLHGRLNGFMAIRFIMQPIVAVLIATRAGLKDARAGRPAFFWALFTEPSNRRELLREGWRDLAKLFIVAIILDLVYQVVIFRWIYPGESLIVAASLAFLPYLVIRGPVNRFAKQCAQWGARIAVRRNKPVRDIEEEFFHGILRRR